MCKLQNLRNRLQSWNGSYLGHPEAVVVSCFFNPQNSPYRLSAFKRFYKSIEHLNHRVVECVIGDSKPQLPESRSIQRLHTKSLLWHKESLINYLVERLPSKFRYVFWLDTDVLFTNRQWLVQGVEALQHKSIIQPFDYCIHLDRDELKPSFNVEAFRPYCSVPLRRHAKLWRGFAASHADGLSANENYDIHGHVGFAWGARRGILDQVPLFDRALIGGADHIMAHAAAGQIPHPCITKSFTENLDEVLEWSHRFHRATQGQLGYVPGDLYHLWHGSIENRQYFQRIRDFTSRSRDIMERDESGLYVNNGDDSYMQSYFEQREVTEDGLEVICEPMEGSSLANEGEVCDPADFQSNTFS